MSITDLKQELANTGTDITSRAVKARLRSANRQAQKEASEKFHTTRKEQVTQRIQEMLSVLAIFFVGGFLVLGNIATVLMFPVAEFVAVRRGIMAFEDHNFIASFNAATIVIGYVVLLFIKYVLYDNLPHTKKLYRSTRITILFIQVAIVLFGFLGRTSDALISGASIGVVEVIGYSGTLVLTIALLAVTDITVLFIYSIFKNNVGVLNLNGGDEKAMMSFLDHRAEELQIEVINDLLIMANAQQNSLQE